MKSIVEKYKVQDECIIKSEESMEVETLDEVRGESDDFRDPMSMRWIEKYSSTLEKIWSILPINLAKFIVTSAVIILGATLRGEWLLLFAYSVRHIGYTTKDESISNNITSILKDRPLFYQNFAYFHNFVYFWAAACIVSYSMYFAIGGFLHWYFYIHQRERAEEWKCQPKKWLPSELERQEIILGSFSLMLTSTLSAVIACYTYNEGPSRIYYSFSEYPLLWWCLQWPVVFLYMDYVTYWLHRMYHTPWLYKNFHKLHHKYKQPTAFSVTAIHPVEILHIQCTMLIPLFVVPLHWVPYCTIVMYNYYHGILDHSGIDFKAHWWQPWQPDAIFHDNHHQYFHVNFGFNCALWDKIHGTHRQKDRIYTENIFYGKGKSFVDATTKELLDDIEERRAENPVAHRTGEFLTVSKQVNEELNKMK